MGKKWVRRRRRREPGRGGPRVSACLPARLAMNGPSHGSRLTVDTGSAGYEYILKACTSLQLLFVQHFVFYNVNQISLGFTPVRRKIRLMVTNYKLETFPSFHSHLV